MPTNGGIIGPENRAGTSLSQAEKVTTFTSSGTFTAQPLSTAVTYVIVAGGGGGGATFRGGGGGAGGFRTGPAVVVSAQGHAVTIGAGGAAGTGASNSGVDSSFAAAPATITSDGGGGGGAEDSVADAGEAPISKVHRLRACNNNNNPKLMYLSPEGGRGVSRRSLCLERGRNGRL